MWGFRGARDTTLAPTAIRVGSQAKYNDSHASRAPARSGSPHADGARRLCAAGPSRAGAPHQERGAKTQPRSHVLEHSPLSCDEEQVTGLPSHGGGERELRAIAIYRVTDGSIQQVRMLSQRAPHVSGDPPARFRPHGALHQRVHCLGGDLSSRAST
jgi:hypothetical protein